MVSHGLRLDLEHSPSSQKIDSVGVEGEVTPEPHARAHHEGSEVQEEGVPVPEEIEGIEDVVHDAKGDQ